MRIIAPRSEQPLADARAALARHVPAAGDDGHGDSALVGKLRREYEAARARLKL